MTIRDIFDTLDYGPSPESETEAKAFLDAHDRRFGHFLNGSFTAPGAQMFATAAPARGQHLADVTLGSAADVDAAVAAARRAFPKWSKLPGHQRPAPQPAKGSGQQGRPADFARQNHRGQPRGDAQHSQMSENGTNHGRAQQRSAPGLTSWQPQQPGAGDFNQSGQDAEPLPHTEGFESLDHHGRADQFGDTGGDKGKGEEDFCDDDCDTHGLCPVSVKTK